MNMRALVLSLALGALTGLLPSALALSVGPAIRQPVGHRRCRVCRRMADEVEVTAASDDALDDDEAELIEEAKEIARAKRSNMFNEDGVAYAPWLVDQVDEDAMMAAKAMRSMRKRQERDALEEKEGAMRAAQAEAKEKAIRIKELKKEKKQNQAIFLAMSTVNHGAVGQFLALNPDSDDEA